MWRCVKVRLLVHGLGKTPDRESDPLLADSYDDYWNDKVASQPHCCSEIQLMWLDTIHDAWHSDVLARQFCDATVLAPSAIPMELDRLAVLVHSMGNLIVANAAAKKLCAIGSSSESISRAAQRQLQCGPQRARL
jgi:hypothetical protein